jgi:hypothetical protein
VSKALREAIADWLMLLGAVVLLLSLFLTWSHQLPAHWRGLVELRGVPRDPTAWQVYSVADVCLALVAAALVFVSFLGTRRARLAAVGAVGVALAFVVRATDVPPTNGVGLALLTNHPHSGPGETVALVALGLGIAGLALSFTAD